MKAKIIDIEGEEVTMKTDSGKFITVPRKKIKFECYINQPVSIEKNEDKIYILPDASSFWGNDAPKAQKDNKNLARKIIGLTIVVAGCAALIVPIVSIIMNSKEEERQQVLSSCLQNAGGYSGEIKCYEQYGGDGDEETINMLKGLYESEQADSCAQKAREDYVVSDEEWEEASETNDANYAIVLNTRVKNGLETVKACYKNIDGYDSSSLDAKIKDIESDNAALEKILEKQNSSKSSSSIHCSTRTVGSSAYTDCH